MRWVRHGYGRCKREKQWGRLSELKKDRERKREEWNKMDFWIYDGPESKVRIGTDNAYL